MQNEFDYAVNHDVAASVIGAGEGQEALQEEEKDGAFISSSINRSINLLAVEEAPEEDGAECK